MHRVNSYRVPAARPSEWGTVVKLFSLCGSLNLTSVFAVSMYVTSLKLTGGRVLTLRRTACVLKPSEEGALGHFGVRASS